VREDTMQNFKPITGTFLDGIACDIPSNNWTPDIWEREFARYQANGVTDAIIIRVGWGDSMMYDSKIMKCTLCPEMDMVQLFLDLGARYNVRIYMGTFDTFKYWWKGDWKSEVAINKEVIDELCARYGKHPAWHGWYMSHEGPMVRNFTEIRICRLLAEYIRNFDTVRPIMMSPGYDGVKHHKENPIPANLHHERLRETLEELHGLINIFAPMDGHVNFSELEEFMSGTAEILQEYNVEHWSNLETFDRDMPWKFPPIEFAKLKHKLMLAQKYTSKIISFELPHFMSPDSLYPSAGHLYNRYHAWLESMRKGSC